MSSHVVQIAVVGSSEPSINGYRLAYEAGKLLAEAGVVVLCGGLGGIMEAASRGVAEAGGIAVGIVPGSRHDCNKWIKVSISPGMGIGRNYTLVNSADGVLAVEGRLGTLSELCFAMQLGLPIAGLSTWEFDELEINNCSTAEDAVSWLLGVIGGEA